MRSAILRALRGLLVLTVLLAGTVQSADLPTLLAAQPALSRFAAALQATGLDARLRSGQWTVLAPANDVADVPAPPYAAAALPALRAWLMHYLVPGPLQPAATADAGSAHSLAGTPVQLHSVQGTLQVGDSPVRGAALHADNGTIYVLDQPLVPYTP